MISEAQGKRYTGRVLYIYTQEKMWDRYIDSLRKNPSTYNIDDAPEEVKKLYKEEIIKLYSSAVKAFFQHAANRDSYREGVGLLRNLIKYGGKTEADQIVIDQKSRTPRRPALIDELSKLQVQPSAAAGTIKNDSRPDIGRLFLSASFLAFLPAALPQPVRSAA